MSFSKLIKKSLKNNKIIKKNINYFFNIFVASETSCVLYTEHYHFLFKY